MPQQPPKPPPGVQAPDPWPRAPRPLHRGDRNEDRSAPVKLPRGVGLTEPPVMAVAAALVAPRPAVVPRNEFDFEAATPVAMDPDTYHALQTMRAEVLSEGRETAQVILDMLQAQNDAREARERREEAAKRAEADARAERRRKFIVPIITAAGLAIAGIIAAALHGCF